MLLLLKSLYIIQSWMCIRLEHKLIIYSSLIVVMSYYLML